MNQKQFYARKYAKVKYIIFILFPYLPILQMREQKHRYFLKSTLVIYRTIVKTQAAQLQNVIMSVNTQHHQPFTKDN